MELFNVTERFLYGPKTIENDSKSKYPPIIDDEWNIIRYEPKFKQTFGDCSFDQYPLKFNKDSYKIVVFDKIKVESRMKGGSKGLNEQKKLIFQSSKDPLLLLHVTDREFHHLFISGHDPKKFNYTFLIKINKNELCSLVRTVNITPNESFDESWVPLSTHYSQPSFGLNEEVPICITETVFLKDNYEFLNILRKYIMDFDKKLSEIDIKLQAQNGLEILKKEPESLLFLHSGYFIGYRASIQLPFNEITLPQYISLMQDLKQPTDNNILTCAIIYANLKENYFKDKHFYLSNQELYRRIKNRNTKDIAIALEWMIEHNIIQIYRNKIFISRLKIQEDIIAYYLYKVLERNDYVDRVNYNEDVDSIGEREAPDLNHKYFDKANIPSLCSEQHSALLHFTNHGITILNGSAGSGKTFIVSTIIEKFSIFKFLIVSFQGKNVNDIKQAIKDKSSLKKRVSFLTAHKAIKMETEWLQSETHKGYDVLIVEESSLMYPDLLATLLPLVSKTLCKVIFLGDLNQLSSISGGDLFKDLCSFFREHVIQFTHNHRDTEHGYDYVDPLFSSILRGEPKMSPQIFDNDSKNFYIPVKSETAITYKVIETLKKYNLDIKETLIISRTNEVIDKVNKSLSILEDIKYKNKNLVFPNNNNNRNKEGAYHYPIGCKVIFKQNFYELNIWTNVIYVIEKIMILIHEKVEKSSTELYYENSAGEEDTSVDQSTTEETRYYFLAKDLNEHFKIKNASYWNQKYLLLRNQSTGEKIKVRLTAYLKSLMRQGDAITVHASQGSEIKNVIYILSKYSPFETKNLIYTAFSRSKSKRFFIGDIENLEQCSKNVEPNRNTGLIDSLNLFISNPKVKDRKNYLDKLELDEEHEMVQFDKLESEYKFNQLLKKQVKKFTLFDTSTIHLDVWTQIFLLLLSNFDVCKHMNLLYQLSWVSKTWRYVINTREILWKSIWEFQRVNKLEIFQITTTTANQDNSMLEKIYHNSFGSLGLKTFNKNLPSLEQNIVESTLQDKIILENNERNLLVTLSRFEGGPSNCPKLPQFEVFYKLNYKQLDLIDKVYHTDAIKFYFKCKSNNIYNTSTLNLTRENEKFTRKRKSTIPKLSDKQRATNRNLFFKKLKIKQDFE